MKSLLLLPVLCLLGSAQPVEPATAVAAKPVSSLRILATKTGVRFGLWGNPPVSPAPTLFVLANTIEGTLGDPYFRQCGTALAKQGYLCVSIDLPCHGPQQRPGEPAEIDGWRYRAEHGDDFVAENNRRLTEVLDHLIAAGYTDVAKVAVCGTSRGGFLGLHFTGSDPRVRCVVAFGPVTDLPVLREFKGTEGNALVTSLALSRQADKLAGRAVWVIIGDRDERVGTDNAIAFVRRITASALAHGFRGEAELLVPPEPRGHAIPAWASEQAGLWIPKQFEVRPAGAP
jgi:pimeloyl-ACP methyl ester carboxylesterase